MGEGSVRTHPIIISSQQFFVDANISDNPLAMEFILRTEAHMDRFGLHDQNNTNEKSLQVRLMRIIYNEASRVSVLPWVEPDVWLAMSLLRELLLMKDSTSTVHRPWLKIYSVISPFLED